MVLTNRCSEGHTFLSGVTESCLYCLPVFPDVDQIECRSFLIYGRRFPYVSTSLKLPSREQSVALIRGQPIDVICVTYVFYHCVSRMIAVLSVVAVVNGRYDGEV